MPKILRILNRFNLGGPTYNAAYLTKYLAPEYDTMLIGGLKDESEDSSEFIAHSLGITPVIIPEMRRAINPMNDCIAYHKIKQIIREFKPDIIHTHASKAGTLGRMAAIKMKIPVVVHTFHGHVFHSYFNPVKAAVFKKIERHLAYHSSAVIAISEKQKEELSYVHKICSEEKITVIPLGFDLSKFGHNMTEKRVEFRKQYYLDDDEIAIGIVGRLVPVKNHRLFLQVIKYIHERSEKRIRAFVIGDGTEKKKLLNLASQLGLTMVTFTSWIRNVDYVYAGLDIVALTSLNEGTPVSLIEAQAAGKPVISTKVGGVENIIISGETGFLVSDDSGEYGQKLLELVENKQLRMNFSTRGAINVVSKFHYENLIRNTSVLYETLLSGK